MATVDDGVGGAGVSWPEIGVGAFSVASNDPPSGVLDLAGRSVGDGRRFRLVVDGGCKAWTDGCCRLGVL